MKRIAIYSRKSISTDKGDSIGNQIKMVENYFRNEKCSFEVFEDEGFSGGNTNRPAFQNMMEKAEMKHFDIIASYKIDRIARNVVDFVNIYDKLNNLGINLVSVTEGFDPTNPMGKMMMLLLASFAEMERDNISQRVKDNKVENAKMGKWGGGVAPFGYTIKKVEECGKQVSYLEPNEDIDKIQEIYKKYLELESLHQTTKWIFQEYNIKWSYSTVSYILKNPIYVKSDEDIINYLKLHNNKVFGVPNGCGLITYNCRPRKKGVKLTRSDSIFFAISKSFAPLDSKLWIDVQELQHKRTQKPRPKNSQISYVTGLLRCGNCGGTMTVNYNHTNKDGTRHYYYVCNNKRKFGASYCSNKNIAIDIMDDWILNKLGSITIQDIEEKNDNSNDIKKIEKKIKSNDKKIENLVDKLSSFSGQVAISIENKLNDLSKENEDLSMKLWNLKKNTESKSDKFSKIQEVQAILNSTDIDGKRELLSSIIQEIVYSSESDSITISYN